MNLAQTNFERVSEDFRRGDKENWLRQVLILY